MIRIEFADSFNVPVKLIAGLRWESVEPKGFAKAWFKASRSAKAVMVHKVISDSNGADTQFGITKSRDALGDLSGAALIARSHPEDTFFAVIPVRASGRKDVKYWLIGVDQGGIIPGTDVVADQHEISNALHEIIEYGLGDEHIILAPGCSELFEGAVDDLSHDEYFDSKHLLHIPRLQRLGYRKYVISILVVFLCAWGYGQYSDYVEHRRALSVQSQKPKTTKIKRTAEQLQEEAIRLEREMLRDFLSSNKLSQVTEGVKNIVNNLPFALNGWSLSTIEVSYSESSDRYLLRMYLSSSGGMTKELLSSLIQFDFIYEFSPNGKLVVATTDFTAGNKQDVDLQDALDGSGKKRLKLVDEIRLANIDVEISNPKKVARPRDLPDYLYAPDNHYFIPVSGMLLKGSGVGMNALNDLGMIIEKSRIGFKFHEINISVTKSMEWELKGTLYE